MTQAIKKNIFLSLAILLVAVASIVTIAQIADGRIRNPADTSNISGFLVDNADDTTTGQLTAANFVASSATATSTFAGGLTIDGTDFVVDPDGALVSIGGDLTISGGNLTFGTSLILSGGDTTSLNLIDAIDATTETTLEAAIDSLTSLTAVGTLTTGTIDLPNVVTAPNFVADSATATSTFAGGLTMGSAFVVDPDGVLVGIGTSTPNSALRVKGLISTDIVNDTDGATITIDWKAGNVHAVTLGGNRAIAFSNAIFPAQIKVYVSQDATGSRTLTYPSSVSWNADTAPTLSTGAGAMDVLIFHTATSTETVWATYETGY